MDTLCVIEIPSLSEICGASRRPWVFEGDTVKTQQWINVGLMLVHRLRRCPSIKQTLVHCLMCAERPLWWRNVANCARFDAHNLIFWYRSIGCIKSCINSFRYQHNNSRLHTIPFLLFTKCLSTCFSTITIYFIKLLSSIYEIYSKFLNYIPHAAWHNRGTCTLVVAFKNIVMFLILYYIVMFLCVHLKKNNYTALCHSIIR